MRKITIVLMALLVLLAFTAPTFAINPSTQFGKATGGGSIVSHCDPTQSAKFSFTAWETKNGVKGNVGYKDTPCNIILSGKVDVFTCLNNAIATSAHLAGPATVNGQSGFTYSIDVLDSGSPSQRDTFNIAIFGPSGNVVYANGFFVVNGNIQVTCTP